ncbi:MAG TPA: GNAT family N-acetyltransferase [Kofleriaceae bacterium]
MSFSVHADAWLSEVMRRPVFRVQGSGDTGELSSHIAAQPSAFYFAKVSTDRVADVFALAEQRFAVVDTNVTFELKRELDAPASFDVGEIRAGEEDAVLAIAGSTFRYSRFHLDPVVGLELAHHVKREWIANYVKRVRGDALLVARENGRPVGFLAAIMAHDTAVIDLVGAANDMHGKGVGSALTAAFAHRYRGMPRIVGTQIANVPSIRLYTKLGFVLSKSAYVLHLHHNRGG